MDTVEKNKNAVQQSVCGHTPNFASHKPLHKIEII